MKRIQYHQYGGASMMRLEAFEVEAPGKGQLLVKVKYAAINPIDWKLRNGAMKILTGNTFPRAMGLDFSGTVISTGRGVTRFAPGDHVFGMARLKQAGAFGEMLVTNESFVTHKPDTVSFEDAACLATPGIMAWRGLVEKSRLRAGQHVFVNGCAGAVGIATIQIAQMLGAIVSGSCRREDMEKMQKMGLAHVYDYRKVDLHALTQKFDIVYDTSTTISASTGMKLLKKNGVFLDLDPKPMKFLRAIFSKNYQVLIGSPSEYTLGKVATAAELGKLQLPIGRIVSLIDGVNLMSEIEGGLKIGGKGVIAME